MRIEGLPTTLPDAPRVDQRLALRDDFRRALEAKIESFLGEKGSVRRTVLEAALPGLGGESLDLNRLPDQAKRDLSRLQGAAEGLEAIFIKDLLSRVRQTSLGEAPSAMANLAKDLMDQAVAEQAAKGSAGLGIARTVFLSTAEPLVRAATTTEPMETSEEHVEEN
jgi:hypothetical protein